MYRREGPTTSSMMKRSLLFIRLPFTTTLTRRRVPRLKTRQTVWQADEINAPHLVVAAMIMTGSTTYVLFSKHHGRSEP